LTDESPQQYPRNNHDKGISPGLHTTVQIMRGFLVQNKNRSGVYFMYMSTGSADLRLKSSHKLGSY
jgi:hypothetical protein